MPNRMREEEREERKEERVNPGAISLILFVLWRHAVI